jgi:hypothetical protein
MTKGIKSAKIPMWRRIAFAPNLSIIQPKKAGDEDVDTCNKAGRRRYCHDFSHDFFCSTLCLRHAFVQVPG